MKFHLITLSAMAVVVRLQFGVRLQRVGTAAPLARQEKPLMTGGYYPLCGDATVRFTYPV